MGRPLFTAPIVGLILGISGRNHDRAPLELMFMGSIMVGSAAPPGSMPPACWEQPLPSKRGGSRDSRCTGSASVHIPADVGEAAVTP